MSNPLPMIIAGVAALLLVGGKKKRAGSKTEQATESPQDSTPDEGSMAEAIPGLGTGGEYGVVAKGVRKDRRGHFPWQVYLDRDGYHAQIMLDTSRFAPVQEEVGRADSSGAAKIMLKNRFNELLLEKYPSEKPKNDPAIARAK